MSAPSDLKTLSKAEPNSQIWHVPKKTGPDVASRVVSKSHKWQMAFLVERLTGSGAYCIAEKILFHLKKIPLSKIITFHLLLASGLKSMMIASTGLLTS